MQLNNSKIKFIIIISVVLIIAVISIILSIINLFLLSNINSGISSDYADSVQAAAYIPTNTENTENIENTTEIITGTVSLNETAPSTSLTPPSEREADVGRDALGAPQTTEDQLYVITPSGRRYHLPTCGSARNISRHLSKEEAEELGYTPCGTCKP